MQSLGRYLIIRRKNLIKGLVIFVAIFAFALALAPSSVYAAGEIGSGVDAGGNTGGAQTRNGWGWYNYPTNGGEKPYGYRNGDTWSRVSGLCNSLGADRVISFIVLRSSGTNANTGVVYNYKTSWNGFSHYNGNAGGNWLPTNIAKSIYDSIDANKTGYTWGDNVAWFCYSSNPVNYSLSPLVGITSSNIAEPGSGVTMSPSIGNSGGTDSKSTTQWKFTYFEVRSGGAIPHNGAENSNESNPCSFYSGTQNCKPAPFIKSGSAVADTNSGSGLNVPKTGFSFTGGRYANVENLSAGTKVCYALSVQPRANDSSQWRYSKPECVTIGTKPKVQVWGADLIAGSTVIGQPVVSTKSNVQTSTSVKNVSGVMTTYGSWDEYGVRASGNIIGIGSGSAYEGGLANSTNCKASQLSFTNGSNSTCVDSSTFGGYVSPQPIPDVAASFPISSSTSSLGTNPTIDLSNSNIKGVNTATGNINISGGTIEAGRWVVINAPNSTVTISGNINYTSGSITSIYDIPQLVIIAKNINIQGGVTNVDAWLIATTNSTGEINTCSDVSKSASLSSLICNKKLTVNGPVVASKLYLRRTYNTSNLGEPSEVFNTRADAYMWAYVRSLGDSRAQTVYSVELPPRL